MNLISTMPRLPVLMTLCLLAGCKTHLDPVSYSPDYSAITRADGRVELVPQTCIQPAAEDEIGVGEDFQPLLPPGCASNLILLQMVEQRADVMQGRSTGPVMAAPVGRAAQVYIDGYDREERRRRQAEQQANTDTTESR
ncbi:hypothetical protein [Pseudomonas syringae]|uniref:hypothetical protein n=1 Tax=Pseudomonas syringae TaxID=317 RepID=UPI000462EABB|nr:hypothetical protein [Pseudomonas syringae]